MPQAVYIIWWIVIIVAILAAPLLVVLLHRTWNAARSIEQYFANMLEAGLGIANNTDHITALEDTIGVASDMLGTAGNINEHAETIKNTLAQRAA